MYNKKVLIDSLKKLGSAKAPAQKKDIIVGLNNPTQMLSMKKGGSSVDKRLSVRKSNIQGKGLFIDQPIKKGEIIGLAHVNNQATPVVGKYHNHSEDNPTAINISKGNKRYLVAARNLPAGTEITTNYRLQPDLEQPEDFMQKGGMTPQKDGYRTYSPFKHLPFIDVESDTIDTDNIVYDLQLVGNNGVIKNVEKNSGLHSIPGASVIREIPIGRKGGSTPKLPKKKNSRAYSRSLEATNRFFAEHAFFAQPKSRKNKIYDPNAKYYQDGGDLPQNVGITYLSEDDRSHYSPLDDTIYLNPNASDSELNHELVHAWQNRTGRLRSNPNLPQQRPPIVASDEQAASYYTRKGDDVDYYLNNLSTLYPNLTDGNIWTEDINRFIPEQIKYDKVIDPLMYLDPNTMEGEAEMFSQVYGPPPGISFRKKGGALPKAQKGLSHTQLMQAYDDSLALYNSYNQFMNVLKNPQYKLPSTAISRYQGRNQGFGPWALPGNLYQNISPVKVFTYYQGNQPWRVFKYKKPVKPKLTVKPNQANNFITKSKPCVPKITVVNKVPEKIPFGKILVSTTEKMIPVASANNCEYVKIIEPVYKDFEIQKIEFPPVPELKNGPLPELQTDVYYPEPLPEAPQYELEPYTDERLRLSIEPGKTKSKKHTKRLFGHGQKYSWHTYKPSKDLELRRKEVVRLIPALVQKLTGYDPKYFEGYEDEEGNFVPGELDYGNATGSEMEFRGAASLRDYMNQKKYAKEYDEYQKKLDEWDERYEQSKKKQAEGVAFKYGGLSNYISSEGYKNATTKYYQDGGENSCEPFYKWDSTLNKCVPFTEEEKANYSLQYMRDWTNSPMHKEMLTTSVGKDAPLGDVNKYVDNITNLRLKALNSNLRIEDVDPKQKGVIGEAAPLGSDPYVNNVPVIIRNGNKQTINPKVSTEDDIKNYNTFRSPLYYSQLNNAKFKDATLENFTKDFKGDATFYTRNRPGEHAYVYPHEFSHLSDFGGDLIPISDRNLIKEWQSHYPDYPAAYDKYVLEDVKSLADQYTNKIITKDEYDKRIKDLKTDWYLNNKDKRYYSDKEMYENNFNKFKKQGDYSDDTLTNDLPYDDFIRKNKINFDPVDYKRYVGTNSEVRARVNAIRMYGKAAGIYDPFTEKLTPEKYKKLNKLFENQNLNEKDVNQLRQLKHLYNDDEILNLINTLSKNDSEIENDIQYGKKGGALPKAQDGIPQEFYQNWYQNRIMPTPEGQKLLDKIRPEALERSRQMIPYIYSDKLEPDDAGYYDTKTQQIILNKFLPEAQIEATKQHEFGHHIQAGNKFYNVLDKPHQFLVEQNIIEPEKISTGNSEWDEKLKENYDYVTQPDEMHARIMTLRRLAGFQPNQVITEKDLKDYFNRVKEAGEALDPDIEDLRGVTKGNQSIVNLLNDMVSVPSNREDLNIAQFGGSKENCPLGFIWNGIECIPNPFETRPSQRAAVYMDENGTYKMDPVYQQYSQQKFNVAQSNKKAQDFNKMYAQSKNYKRLLKKQGYTPKEIEDRINSVMNVNDFRYIDQGQSWVGTDENTGKEFISYNVTDPGDWPGFDQIAAHEWGHVGVDSGANPLKKKEREEFINRINKEQAGVTGNPDDLVHDMEPQENRADLLQLRQQLQEAGVFDSTKRKRFTKKDLDKYRKLMESSERNWDNMWNRMFRLYDDDSIIYFMNNVAKNDSDDNLQVAKQGLELDLSEDEIKKYVDGGYIVEDISVPSLTRMKKGGLPCPPFCSPLIELSKGLSTIARNIPKTNSLNKFIANAATLADESLGQAFLSKSNAEAIAKGNQWLNSWIQHPTTQMKIKADMLDVINNKNLNKNSIIYTTPRYGDIVLSPKDQYIGALQIAQNYAPDVTPYSTKFSLSNLKQNKLNPMVDNIGISYTHQSDPIMRSLYSHGYFKPYSTQIDTEYKPFEHYGSFVSQSPKYSPYRKELTTIHEGTHDWISNKLLNETGQSDLILSNIDPEVKKLSDQLSLDPNAPLTKEEKKLIYLAKPTEVHARIMELRRHNNLSPSDYVDEDMAKHYLEDINNNKSAIDSEFSKVINNDPKILSKLMNDLYNIAIPLGVGIGGAALLKNPYKEESPIGGYKMGGEFELGDEVDEATMKELKKLGFTFQKI